MKNRFSRMGKTLLGAVCLLSTCGLTYSCSDDYDLDETMPSFLGGSIYDELSARGFNTVVKLINDLGYRDVMAQTGSKTLFAATDEAYERFFATTTWTDGSGNPVRSYDQLSTAQKSILLYGSMLNNADVLEMLPYSSGGGNLTMRRTTQLAAIDSVPYWRWDELPNNLNEAEVDDEGNSTGDNRFWDRFRTQARGGIYMALDATQPMMVHFLDDQLQEAKVTHEDVSFVLNEKDDPWLNGSQGGNRAYVYGSRITQQDITCMNGYINVIDSVIVTPSNMAEVIRTNGQTNLFSRMLDRFSAPYYNSTLTEQYRALYDIGTDSVYEKRYLSSRSQGNASLSTDFDGNSLGSIPLLTYDPGWNEYAISSSVPKEQDMGAMFVPTDEAMINYFVNGGGVVLMERYAKLPNTAENLEYNLYQIPLEILRSLINNLMKDSFLESVPSKYLTIMNDAQDQMFPATNAEFSTQQGYESHIVKCLLANNGVVYVLDQVITPADYASVIAPALYSENTTVVRTVIQADDSYIEGTSYNNAPLKKYYSTYLKAMQSRFSFFVPTDEGLNLYGYVDPMSLSRGAGQSSAYKYWRFTYRNSPGAALPINAQAYRYNMQTGQTANDNTQTSGGTNANQSGPTGTLTSGAGLTKGTLLIEMIDQHIVVHDTNDADNDEGVNAKRSYFTSRGGAPVYVKDRGDIANNNVGMIVDGGFQIQLNQDGYPENDHDCVVTEGYDMTEESNGYGNGKTYLIDRPMQPTTRSVYNIFNSDAEHYGDFLQLCLASFSEGDLTAAGFRVGVDDDDWSSVQNSYRIFTSSDMNPAANEQLVRFFNNYRYTIYAPTNAAIQDAIARGLPTYDDIHDFIEANSLGEDEDGYPTLSPENQKKAQAMITMLINFLKYHFQDGAYYVDNVTSENDYQTSCIDNENNVYLSIHVAQTPGAMTVTDNNGNTQNVVAPFNVLARDVNFNASANPTSYQYSSYVAIHQVNQVLNFAPLSATGRYDDAWATPEQAQAFVQKYSVRPVMYQENN